MLAVGAGLCVAVPAGAVVEMHAMSRSIAYTCTFPTGRQQVRVTFADTFPKTGMVNKPVTSGIMHVTMTLPPTLVGALAKTGATHVTGVMRLTTVVTQNGSPAPITSPNLAITDADLGSGAAASLAASGRGPGVTVAVPGKVGFAAADLGGTLTLRRADGTAAGPPQASFTCTPDLGQNTTLASVPIADTSGSSGVGQNTNIAAAQEDLCPPEPTSDFSTDFPLPDIPPGADVFDNPDPLKGCAKLNGFTNIQKLNGAASVTGKAGLAIGIRTVSLFIPPFDDPNNNYIDTDSTAVTYIDTVEATFLTFGFMPTTAKVDITQVGKTTAFRNANITAIGYLTPLPDAPARFTTASAYVSLRVHDVRVNGVPLDVGPDCRIAEPMRLQVSGSTRDNPEYDPPYGGYVRGTVTIPPFQGCGVGEDLDPLLTASISGPGNYMKLTQGPLCAPSSPYKPDAACPMQDFGWTVTPGGSFQATSTGPITFTLPSATITCDSSSFSGTLTPGSSAKGNLIGTMGSLQLENCHGTDALNGTLTVTSPSPQVSLATYDSTANTVAGQIDNMSLTFSFGAKCKVPIGSTAGFTYSNETHTMSMRSDSIDGTFKVNNVRFCAPSIKRDDPVIISGGYTFDVPQKISRPFTS